MKFNRPVVVTDCEVMFSLGAICNTTIVMNCGNTGGQLYRPIVVLDSKIIATNVFIYGSTVAVVWSG